MIEYQLYTGASERLKIADGFFGGWPNPPDQRTHRAILKNSYKAIVAVDTESQTIIGFINIISDGVLSAYIPLLEVIPSYRKRGIGHKLVERAIEETKELYMLDLSCDEDMLEYYRQFGMLPAQAMLIRNYDRQAGNVEACPVIT